MNIIFPRKKQHKEKQSMVYKCALLGDSGVGKTVLLKHLTAGGFEKRMLPTYGNGDMYHFEVKGELFDVIDTAGQEKMQFDRASIEGIDCAIVMFDLTSMLTYKNVAHWLEFCRDVPHVVCGNKIDIQDRKVDPVYVNDANPGACFISVKTGQSIVTPFIELITMLKNE
jgi:GTP-binding nuclear protein Ran